MIAQEARLFQPQRDHRSAITFFTVIGLLLWSTAGATAQSVAGTASAVQGTVAGIATVLAGTGPLASADDARAASELAAAIPLLGGAEVLHAATISSIYGWDSLDEVISEASLGNLVLTVAGNRISADFAMARAVAPVGGVSTGSSTLEGLVVNGIPIVPSGAPSETFYLPGITLTLNEMQTSATGTAVNALHVVSWDGLVNVVIASATAAVHSALTTPPSTLSTTTSKTGLPSLF